MTSLPLSCSACKARRLGLLWSSCHTNGNGAKAPAAAGHSNAVLEFAYSAPHLWRR